MIVTQARWCGDTFFTGRWYGNNSDIFTSRWYGDTVTGRWYGKVMVTPSLVDGMVTASLAVDIGGMVALLALGMVTQLLAGGLAIYSMIEGVEYFLFLCYLTFSFVIFVQPSNLSFSSHVSYTKHHIKYTHNYSYSTLHAANQCLPACTNKDY